MFRIFGISFGLWFSGLLLLGYCFNYIPGLRQSDSEPATVVLAPPMPSIEPVERFYPSGATKLKGQLKNNKSDGTWYAYYEDGTLMSQGEMVNGIPKGSWNFYHANSKLKETVFYNEIGNKHGNIVTWNDNGTKFCEVTYDNGLKHGNFVEYYPNGKKKYEGNYKFDKRVDLWYNHADNGEINQALQYNTEGTLISFQQYKNGKKQDMVTYSKDKEVIWWKLHKHIKE